MSRFESVLESLPQADLGTFIGYLPLDVLRNVVCINRTLSRLIRSTDAYWQTIYMQRYQCSYVACEEDLLQWYRTRRQTDTGATSRPHCSWRAMYQHRKRLEQRIRNGHIVQQSIELPRISGCYWHVVATSASGFLVLARNTQTITSDHVYLIRTPSQLYDSDTPPPSLHPPRMIELETTVKIESFSQMSYHINHEFIVISHRTAFSVWKTQCNELYTTYYFDSAVNIISIREQWVLLEQQTNEYPHLLLNLLTGDKVTCVIPVPPAHSISNNVHHEPRQIEDTCANGVTLYCNHTSHDSNTSTLYWSLCRVDARSGIVSMLRYGSCQVDAAVFGHFAFRQLGSGLVAWNFRLTTTQRRNMAVHSTDGNGDMSPHVFAGANVIHRISKNLLLIMFSKRIELYNIDTRQIEFTWYHSLIQGPFIPIIGPYWLVYEMLGDDDDDDDNDNDDGIHLYGRINELRIVESDIKDTMNIWRALDVNAPGKVTTSHHLYATPCGMLYCPKDTSSLFFYGY